MINDTWHRWRRGDAPTSDGAAENGRRSIREKISFPEEVLPRNSLSRNFSRRIYFQGRVMLERADKRRREIVKDELNDAPRDTLEKTSN